MKKILLLLLVTISGYGQTLQNPTFGNTTTNTLKIKTPATVTSVNFLSTNEADGSVSKIAPKDINIPYLPVNYSVLNESIGEQIKGIDVKLGSLSTTTAGITQRVYFTADNTTVNSVVYFASSLTGKGSTATGSPPSLVLADNTKAYFSKDVISIAQPSTTIGYAGTYSGNLTVSASPTPNATQQRFTVEIYRTNNLGTPIASGVSGSPTGDLGVTVVAILDSGIINLTAGSITNIPVSGILTQNITINTGERLRYHVSAAKIGAGGGNVTFGVYYGNSYNSYYDVPVAITTDAVLNKSNVSPAITDTDALNLLYTTDREKLNSYSLVTDNKVYSAFPTIAKVGSNLLTVYRKAPDHYTAGIIVGRISTDNGSSWGNEFTVLSEASWNLSATSLKLLANGNIMLIFSRDNGLVPIGNSDVRSVLLNSSGVVISSPVILGGYSGNYSAFGQMVQLTNANILVPVYGIDAGSIKVKVMQSVNNGVSWTSLATLATSATTDFAQSIDETSLLLLPNGTIVAALRNEVTDKIAFSKSTNNGVTWSTVTDKFDGESAASLGYTADNKIIVSYRIKTTSETAFRYSYDEGNSFTTETTLEKENPHSFNYLYSGFVNIGNQMGYVYSLETSDDNACILFRFIHENQPFGDIISTKSLGLTNYADLDIINGDLRFSPRALNNIITNADNTYTGSLLIQAGSGSATFGGGYSLFGASHPSKAGWTQANISNTTGAKFSINNQGAGAGSNIFTVDRSGNTEALGTFKATVINSYGSRMSGDIDGTWSVNYNNGATGSFDFYGGTTSIKASVSNNGIPTQPYHLVRKQDLDASKPYKVYIASMSQTGTSAPSVIVLENTIGSIVWTYNSTGYTIGTLSGAFPVGKVYVNGSNANAGSSSLGFRNATTSTIDIRNFVSGVLANGYEAYIEIRIYP